MVFNFLEHWRQAWHNTVKGHQEMPLTEKEPAEEVPYAFPIKKVRVQPDIELAYIDEGPRDGSVVLFIHGLAGGIPAWQKNIPELSKRFRCIAFDLPGHGHSTKGDFSYDMAFFSRITLLFMDALGLNTVTLAGHSMGGQIAIILALKQPERIKRLVLVAPAGVEPYTPSEKQWIINMVVGMSASGNAFTQYRLNYLMAFNHDAAAAGELVQQLAFYKQDGAMMSKLLTRSIEGMLLACVNKVLHQVRQPSLVLVGNEDQVSPYQYFHRQHFAEITKVEVAKMPHASLRIFSPGGHYLQYQRSRTFNKEVIDFLSEK